MLTAVNVDVALHARREVEEEVGVRLDGPLAVESTLFATSGGTRVLNVVMLAPVGDQTPVNNSPGEVADMVRRTLDEVAGDTDCPPWTLQSLRRAEAVRAEEAGEQ